MRRLKREKEKGKIGREKERNWNNNETKKEGGEKQLIMHTYFLKVSSFAIRTCVRQ